MRFANILMILALCALALMWFLVSAAMKPAYAQDYGYDPGYWQDSDPEFYSDIQNSPDMIIYRNRGYRSGYHSRQPEYWSDIEQQPDLIIYPGRRGPYRR